MARHPHRETAPGYDRETAKLALLIPPGYSDSQIDMVHFSSALARNDGKPIGGLTASRVGDENFQQWSRHRTPKNPSLGREHTKAHTNVWASAARRPAFALSQDRKLRSPHPLRREIGRAHV